MHEISLIIDRGGSWETALPLIEFAYNNNFQATISMAPYEALYGRKCRSPLYWDEVGERRVLGPDAVEEMIEIVTSEPMTAPPQKRNPQVKNGRKK